MAKFQVISNRDQRIGRGRMKTMLDRTTVGILAVRYERPHSLTERPVEESDRAWN